MKWIVREKQRNESDYNAGSKARKDIEISLLHDGFNPCDGNFDVGMNPSFVGKLMLQIKRYFEWKKATEKFSKGDIVVIQFPIRNHSIFFYKIVRALEKQGVKTVCIVHDLESLRQSLSRNIKPSSRIRFKAEEISVLRCFSKIVVHNEHMKKAINEKFGIPLNLMESIDIFDYLYQRDDRLDSPMPQEYEVVIAGNLDKRKSGYIYNLPKDVVFNLYGANFQNDIIDASNVIYRGKFPPDELPKYLKGDFGLVWDGPTSETCAGAYGEYLRVNNPHKTSLYLAAGIPVIVWKESAMADFVIENKCGIVIGNLYDIRETVNSISEKDYDLIKENALLIGEKISKGEYIHKVIRRCLS